MSNNQECQNQRQNYVQLSVPEEWKPIPGSNGGSTECDTFEFTYQDQSGDQKTGELFMEVNQEKKIAFVGVTQQVIDDGFPQDELESNNAYTKCTRDNGCSDKPTTAGVILCAGECAVDVVVSWF